MEYFLKLTRDITFRGNMGTTVNVYIFTCINFLGFLKMGNFTCIKIRGLNIIGTIVYFKSNFRDVHIFADI